MTLNVRFLESIATWGERIGVCTVSGIFVCILRPPTGTSVWKEEHFIYCKYWSDKYLKYLIDTNVLKAENKRKL